MQNKDGKLIYNSLKNNGIISFIGKVKWINKIKKIDFLEYEHLGPDLICITEKDIYGIEHFYVDASEIKKGSKLKSEYNNSIKNDIIPNIQKELKKKDISSSSYEFKSTLNYENLKNNTYTNFNNHYKNISLYNKNIEKEYGTEKDIKIIFFIEYNILPSIHVVNGKPEKQFYPFNDINFLKYFINKKEIKGIIFSVNSKNYYIPIKNKYNVDNINIFDFTGGEIEDFGMKQMNIGIKI